MTLLARAGVGLAISGAATALFLMAGGVAYQAWRDGPEVSDTTRKPKERTYAVTVDTLISETATPEITAYGRLASGRILELRSSLSGSLVELSPNFRDGGAVETGELLYRIDPSKLETNVALAEIDLKEAEAGLVEARTTLELARLEVEKAQQQLDLREQAVARQEDLRDRGVATAADVEGTVLARASAEQTLVNRRQVVAGDEARVAQSEITLDRRKIALAEARRALDDSAVTASFSGILTSVTAVLGGLVSTNQQLAVLMDPNDIEVAFRVTSNQYGRLLNANGDLRKTDVVVSVRRGRIETELPAKLDRAGVETDENKIGRVLYAKLVGADPNFIQPGDFVTVRIPERPLEGVSTIPAAAATTDGRILLIGANNRLEEVQATLLRHQGDTLIITDVPFGRQYVTARAVQLGPGIQVSPAAAGSASDTAVPAAPVPAAEPDMIPLDDERRAAIIAVIEASETMKPEKREQYLGELSQPEVPRTTVEKFEAMITGDK